MQIFIEAGAFSLVALGLFVAGLVARARGQATEAWAVAILAAGAVGVALGQRLVARAVEGADDVADKVAIVAAGSAEASANLLIAGVCAGLLIVIGRLRA
jgi:hypothetical protein